METALGKESEGKPNVLFPIRLDKAVMQSRTGWASHIRLTRHIGNFTKWKSHDDYQQAFNRFLRDLKVETIRGGGKEIDRRVSLVSNNITSVLTFQRTP